MLGLRNEAAKTPPLIHWSRAHTQLILACLHGRITTAVQC